VIATETRAFYCHSCGRMEDSATQTCPACHARRNPVSRYEWFLADAIEDRLKACGLSYSVAEQYPLRDPRGFTWYFDLRVSACGRRLITDYVEINGHSHLREGTRDEEKHRAYRLYAETCEPQSELWLVANEECRKAVVSETAARIVASLVRRAL
jgi:hypothetical protein